MTDDDIRELLELMDEPAPVPDRFLRRLWNDLAHSIDDSTTATSSLLSIVEDSETGAPEQRPILGVPTVETARRPRRTWPIVTAAAAAVAVIVALVLAATGPDDSVETDGFAAAPGVTSSSLPDQRVTDEDPSPPDQPPAFAKPVQVAQIGNSFLRIQFTTVGDSAYTAVVRTGDRIVDTVSGAAEADETVDVTVQDLTPGTVYTVQVTLIGPPTATSSLIEIRTAGGEAESGEGGEAVELRDLRITALAPTQFQLNYETNVCANGSFVIFEENGPEVGRNDGQPEGCTTQHLAVPGKWTEPLRPDTTYVITVTVEANGAGLGNGNVDSRSLTVTTAKVASEPVEIVDVRVVDVGPTHFQVDYESNVCANGSFVVTRDGVEVGRNDGLPSGCGTEHLAIPGQWTPELEPDTAYVITITLEANGAGLGEGNETSTSIEVLTATS